MRRREGDAGYVPLDLLVAFLIVVIGFAVLLGGISLAGALTVRQAERVQLMIEQRNADAKETGIVFQRK